MKYLWCAFFAVSSVRFTDTISISLTLVKPIPHLNLGDIFGGGTKKGKYEESTPNSNYGQKPTSPR